MGLVRNITGQDIALLADDWRMARTPADAFSSPPRAEVTWIATTVPCTAAACLIEAGLWDCDSTDNLDDYDYWFCREISETGHHIVRCNGLASIAEVWINGVVVLQSNNMFLRHDIEVELDGVTQLAICFRSLSRVLAKPLKRARWRSRLVQPPSVRGVRTSLIGRMPSWCPPTPIIGPWRSVELVKPGKTSIATCDVRTSIKHGAGIVCVDVTFEGDAPSAATLAVEQWRATFHSVDAVTYSARVEVPGALMWWPHTHGTPNLYKARVEFGGGYADIGSLGFRNVEVDRDADGKGFGLRINGVDVFCRGSVWTNVDILNVPGTREAYEPLLKIMRDADMNMVRVGGTFAYETAAFFELCNEYGIMVWQDLMFANLDYPLDDSNFRAIAEAEVKQVVGDTQSSPSLVVICGGSEVFQQAAMMGLAADKMRGSWFETDLRQLVSKIRPDVVFVPNTPFGGELPFQPDSGVCHYYGVSAYKRPLEDVRRARVRFASECLGFANVPDELTVAFEPGARRLVQPCWNERVPYDAGALWFFEDVRNHYIEQLYGLKVGMDMSEARYLALARATNAELIEAVFSEFRLAGSPTRGALTWFLKDVWPGAGWGLIDSSGAPKSVYYATKRASRPQQILLADEGLNGLVVHLINERSQPRSVRVELSCLANGATIVMHAEISLQLAPRHARAIPATQIWGAFFDTTYAYRFGPPSHDTTVASLYDAESGDLLAQSFYFPQGRGALQHELGLEARVIEDCLGYSLELSCTRLAQSVCISDARFRGADNWFHLSPGKPRIIALTPRAESCCAPEGFVTALNGISVARYKAST
jgi:beta-mannosidase